MQLLTRDSWLREKHSYLERIEPIVRAAQQRRSLCEKHPVEDFLWEYYGLKPGRLLQWHPGVGRMMLDVKPNEVLGLSAYQYDGHKKSLSVQKPDSKTKLRLKWILNLLQNIQHRPKFWGCMGLHEWAMIYNEADIRHEQMPLRVEHSQIRQILHEHPVQCSHYDAFRFFSEEARPLNRLQPMADTRMQNEQGACIHANMDLLKWCLKAMPYVSSSLILEAFLLAKDAREVDMRASPYDLSELGYQPICIELPEGRSEYVLEQSKIAQRGEKIRSALISKLANLSEDC